MSTKLRSESAEETYQRAEQALRRREGGDLAFRSVRVCLGWYYATREKLGSPNTARMRTAIDSLGNEVLMECDLGRGSRLDEVHAVLLTINGALNDLHREPDGGPVLYAILVAAHRDGKSQEQIAKDMHVSQPTVSGKLHEAERYVQGRLRGEGGVLA